MATINFATREITAKVVYFGADKAGTTTAVRHLHSRLPSAPSRLHRFGPSADAQILYFEYQPGALPRFGGFDLRVQVYALPGAVRRREHREEVLRGLDGVVFVADARRQRTQANVDALLQLDDMLEQHQVELARLPVVIVVNHIDDPEARSEAAVSIDLNTYAFPVLSAVASDGRGVLEGQAALLDRLSLQLRANLAGELSGLRLEAVHDPDTERDDEVVKRHIAAIAQRSTELEAVRPGWDDLPPVEVSLPLWATELESLRPTQVIAHSLDSDRVVLDLLFEDPESIPTRVQLTLDPRKRRHSSSAPGDRVGRYLPDSDSSTERDLPPVAYGVLGVAGGVIAGLLTGYLAWLTG